MGGGGGKGHGRLERSQVENGELERIFYNSHEENEVLYIVKVVVHTHIYYYIYIYILLHIYIQLYSILCIYIYTYLVYNYVSIYI